MSLEKNKALIRKWIEARNSHDIEAALALWSDDMQDHVRRGFNAVTEAFPDVHITVNELIAQGNTVVLRWTFQGTHLGLYRDIPATGNKIEWTGIDLYTIVDEKIKSTVREADSLSVLKQLNVTVSWEGRVLL